MIIFGAGTVAFMALIWLAAWLLHQLDEAWKAVRQYMHEHSQTLFRVKLQTFIRIRLWVTIFLIMCTLSLAFFLAVQILYALPYTFPIGGLK